MLQSIGQGVVVDATFGGGGHTRRLLDALPSSVRILGIDRDPAALRTAPEDDRLVVVHGRFGDLDDILDTAGIDTISGALFDLGVSSHQLDEPERGFSYRSPGPLDMRMGDNSLTAGEVVNEWPEADLARAIHTYGEERFAGRIARAICRARPISDTEQLAGIIRDAIPAATRRTGGHPARRTFQALRIVVNDELGELERGLDAALDRLTPGGRCVVISYHSLEDRLVKRRFGRGAAGCQCPPDLPVCVCGRVPELVLVGRKALRPSDTEVAANPRSRSARMRVAERAAA